MGEAGTYSFTYHASESTASVRGLTEHSDWNSPKYPHYPQVSEDYTEESGSSQGRPGSDGCSILHNDGFQPMLMLPRHERSVPTVPARGRSFQGGESPTTTSPGEKPGRRLFQCAQCTHEPYAQKQGLLRHYREKHQPGFECSHPDCGYRWTLSRRYEYKKHLKKKHRLEGDKIDEILAKAPRLSHGSRRRGTEPRQRAPILPFFSVKRDANNTSPTLVPTVASDANPRLWYAESDITTTGNADPSGLGHLAATHGPSWVLSEEEFALLARYSNRNLPIQFP